MIQINLFWVVLLIIITHTILQHLLNWWFRKIKNADENFVWLLCVVLEIFSVIAFLKSLTFNT